jgi:uncharacterized protein (TIGR02246 family)
MNLRNRSLRTRVLAYCVVLVVFAVSAAVAKEPADNRSADERTLRELDAQWSRAAAANDLEATVSYYADDASVLPPNAPTVAGKPAIRTLWSSMLDPKVSVSWQAVKVEVARSGDLAYLLGAYRVDSKETQGKTLDQGKFVEVWKKQPDGKWKVVADIFNSDLPVAAAPAEKPTSDATTKPDKE